MASSPWGSIQYSAQIAPGLRQVSTASHGGLLLSHGAAERLHISPMALSLGNRWQDGWAYEEDCEWAILAWEIPQHWPLLFRHAGWQIQADPRTYLIETLSAWCPTILLYHGVSPSPPEFARYLRRRQRDRLRAERSPELIVAARGDWAEGCPPGAVEVTTADDQVHYVTAESYYRVDVHAHFLGRCVPFPMSSASPAAAA